MTKYYRMRGIADPKIIGVNNGVSQGDIIWEKFHQGNSEEKVSNYFSLIKYQKGEDVIDPIDFSLEYIEAEKKAKMTDFFRFSPVLWGVLFLVNDKVKEVFNQFNLPKHVYIPANVYHKNIQHKYWALYIPSSYRETAIDFKRTIFNKGNTLNPKFISFESLEDYKKAGYSRVSTVAFNSTINKELDLFKSSFVSISYLISEKLKIAIQNAGLSGINIGDTKDLEIIFE